jgi:hypothetical protein
MLVKVQLCIKRRNVIKEMVRRVDAQYSHKIPAPPIITFFLILFQREVWVEAHRRRGETSAPIDNFAELQRVDESLLATIEWCRATILEVK